MSDWGAENGYAGSLAQYAGQELTFALAEGSYDLRFGDDLVGRLVRPSQAMAAETREGHWELRHPRRSVARIDAVEPTSGMVVLRYRRRLILPGGSIRGQSAGERYRLRHHKDRWLLTGVDPLLELSRGRTSFEYSLKVEQAPILPADLGLLALLCCYVMLLEKESSAISTGGGTGG